MRRLTKEDKEKIKQLYLEGVNPKEIQKIMSLKSVTSIFYHGDIKINKKIKERSTKRENNLTPEEKRDKYLKKKEYYRDYRKKRYHEDEEFREKIKERQRKYKQGLKEKRE